MFIRIFRRKQLKIWVRFRWYPKNCYSLRSYSSPVHKNCQQIRTVVKGNLSKSEDFALWQASVVSYIFATVLHLHMSTVNLSFIEVWIFHNSHYFKRLLWILHFKIHGWHCSYIVYQALLSCLGTMLTMFMTIIIQAFIHSLTDSFIHSLTHDHSSIHSLIQSLSHALIHHNYEEVSVKRDTQ